MTKEQLPQSSGYYDRYIDLVEANKIFDAFAEADRQLETIDRDLWQKIGRKIYQQDKWTIAEIIQHLIDTERIMTYRALCFARNEVQLLNLFDEDAYAQAASTHIRSIDDVLEELKLVRQSTQALFRSFDKNMFLRSGICMGAELSVLALGFMLVGHQQHHMTVISERYEPLFYS